jgi:hypothetical protein
LNGWFMYKPLYQIQDRHCKDVPKIGTMMVCQPKKAEYPNVQYLHGGQEKVAIRCSDNLVPHASPIIHTHGCQETPNARRNLQPNKAIKQNHGDFAPKRVGRVPSISEMVKLSVHLFVVVVPVNWAIVFLVENKYSMYLKKKCEKRWEHRKGVWVWKLVVGWKLENSSDGNFENSSSDGTLPSHHDTFG